MFRFVLSKVFGLLAITALVIFSEALWAQTPSLLLLARDSSFLNSHAMILVSADGMAGSNAMDNLFLKKMWLGGQIQDSHINTIVGNLHDVNRFGLKASGDFRLYSFSDSLFGKPNLGLQVQASSNYNAHLSFSKDLFRLAFQGNNQFKGDSVQLAPLVGEYQAYQKFGVGVFNKKNFSGVMLSLVSGQDYQAIDVKQSSFYTSSLADTLALTYSGNYFRADTSKSGWGAGKGLGLAVDLNYNLPLESGKGFISIEMNDLGFIAWNKSTQNFSFDSITTWTGYNSNDLFNFSSDSVRLTNLQDSVYYSAEQKVLWRVMPFSVHLKMIRQFTKNSYYQAGVSILPNRTAIPLIYAGMDHFIGDHLIVTEKVTFGGYARWGIGAEIQWMPKGRWLIKAGTNNLVGFISDTARGRDMHLTVAHFFKRQNH